MARLLPLSWVRFVGLSCALRVTRTKEFCRYGRVKFSRVSRRALGSSAAIRSA
ncbi:hypothetical protein D9M71_837970 [compost metagenome]